MTATDGQDRTASIDVEVRVQDLNESPVFHYDSRDLVYMNINDGLVPPASKTIMHTEGDQRRVALFAASDPDNKGIIWEVTGTHATPTRMKLPVVSIRTTPTTLPSQAVCSRSWLRPTMRSRRTQTRTTCTP